MKNKLIFGTITPLLAFSFIFFFSIEQASAYANRCATGGPNNVCSASCTYGAVGSDGFSYTVNLNNQYCCSHFGPSTACSTGAALVGAKAGSGSWAHACGNSWGTYYGYISGVPNTSKGKCGIATTTPSLSQPSVGACDPIGNIAGGTLSSKEDTASTATNWNWKCMGSVANATVDDALCTTPKIINGECGTATATIGYPVPTTNLCKSTAAATGKTTSTTTTTATYNWTCPGSNGGNPASCSFKLKVNGACDNSNPAGACTAGSVAEYDSATAKWKCKGINGGTDALSCAFGGGVCGSASPNGSFADVIEITPALGCQYGSYTSAPPTLSGSKFLWKCKGAGTGGTLSNQCSADRKGGNTVITGIDTSVVLDKIKVEPVIVNRNGTCKVNWANSFTSYYTKDYSCTVVGTTCVVDPAKVTHCKLTDQDGILTTFDPGTTPLTFYEDKLVQKDKSYTLKCWDGPLETTNTNTATGVCRVNSGQTEIN